MDENSTPNEIRDEQRQKISKLKETIGFFASVIKSGERWTQTCENALREAMD